MSNEARSEEDDINEGARLLGAGHGATRKKEAAQVALRLVRAWVEAASPSTDTVDVFDVPASKLGIADEVNDALRAMCCRSGFASMLVAYTVSVIEEAGEQHTRTGWRIQRAVTRDEERTRNR